MIAGELKPLLGALSRVSAESGRRYGPLDPAFAEEPAGRARHPSAAPAACGDHSGRVITSRAAGRPPRLPATIHAVSAIASARAIAPSTTSARARELAVGGGARPLVRLPAVRPPMRPPRIHGCAR
jgi:hypothetical protein